MSCVFVYRLLQRRPCEMLNASYSLRLSDSTICKKRATSTVRSRLGRPRCAHAHAGAGLARAVGAAGCPVGMLHPTRRAPSTVDRSNRPRLHGSLLFKSVAEDRGPLSTAKPADICSKTRNLSPTGCQCHVTFSVSLPRRAWKDSRFLSVTPTWNQPRTLSRAPSTAPSALTRRRTSGSSAQPSTPPDDQ